MPLWVDKYRPKSLRELDFHPTLTDRLGKIAQSKNVPHLLFYGPNGSGKKTRIHCLLREMFGPGVDRVRVDRKTFQATASKQVEITTLSSNFHIEINPSDVGNYDRVVVSEVIKEMAAAQSMASSAFTQKGGSETGENARPYKLVVITEADMLTRAAQQGLRRTMEKYAGTCRLVLCCESLNKVIEPVRSRCLAIRVPSPTLEEISFAVGNALRNEGCTTASESFLSQLSLRSHRNLRRALLMAETSKVAMGGESGELVTQLPDWERYVEQVAKEITAQQSPQILLEVRAKLYELLANCIPPEVIFKSLCNELCKRVDDDLKFQLVHWAAHYQAKLSGQGQKPIYYLEAFVAKFMCLYKEYLVSMFA
ncbi:hypothetical protein BASA81_015357 [Batrachochytrium salamandrivorans]|nr:hypothetical protein BASA81_015357 [Batrachochytrium salamandrivorans]